MLITSKTVNVISMFVIFIYLNTVYNRAHDKQCRCCNKSYPQCLPRERVRNKIANNSKTHYKFTYIIAILGEVVYLLLVQHEDVTKATDVPCDLGQ